ncbi:MAG: MFS transporter [Propionibacteriaceae bacterium]|nr:MFS transporter [Propionibacteriaceae bacterium]
MKRFRRFFADTTPLKTLAFKRLWLANIVTVIGAQLTVVTVPAQLYTITGSSSYVGLAGLFGLVPLIVFGLWGGALADHFDRRQILIVTTCGLILTSAIFWLQAALNLNNVWLLLSVFATQQAFFAVNQPTRTAVLPKILPQEQLPAALTLNMTVAAAGGIIGPLIGGTLLPLLGFSWLYLVDTITLGATLYAVIALPALPMENPQGTPGMRAVIEGFSYLKGHRILLISFGVDVVAMVAGMPRALFPEMAHKYFNGSIEGGFEFALLNTGMAVGAAIGGLFSGWISSVKRQGLAVIGAVLIWGLSIVGFGLGVEAGKLWVMPAVVFAVFMLIAAGAADMASAAFRQSILLTASDDQVRGRLQGVFIVVVVGGPRIADVLHGYAAGFFTPSWTTVGGGVLVILITLLLAKAVPEFMAYRIDPTRKTDQS